MQLILSKKDFHQDVEFVERKGSGHPDTLADGLAETLSIRYSNYTRERFGAVLHHNFDKVGLLGGSSYVAFGKGYMTSPIRVLINGRISTKFGNEIIPTRKLLVEWTKEFFTEHLPTIDPDQDLEFHKNISTQSSPGKTYEADAKKSARQKWFEPDSLADLPEHAKLTSNDTSIGVGYAPASKLEQVVLAIEGELNSSAYKAKHPWLGTDIKIMGCRVHDQYHFTMCLPQIALYVANAQSYAEHLDSSRADVDAIIKSFGIPEYEIAINTRDNLSLVELYLTATGSSIESGDEGLAGRGNRVNKLISPTKPMSMEGSCGKNPIYHIGKIYYVAAFDIANRIHQAFNIPCEVYLVSQSGRDLLDPWIVAVTVPDQFEDRDGLEKLITSALPDLPNISAEILDGTIRIY